MTNARLYFDNRNKDKQGRGRLRVVITKNGTSSMMSLGICLQSDQWKDGKVVNHIDAKLLNSTISIKFGAIQRAILKLTSLGSLAGKSAKEACELIKLETDPDMALEKKKEGQEREQKENSFLIFFLNHIEPITNVGTRTLYMDTYKKICAFCAHTGKESDSLSFNDITPSWLDAFKRFCLSTQRINTANRHLRDIRAVINAAIDEGKSINYPFRKFKIRQEESKDKSHSSEELRKLFNHDCYSGGEQEAVDMFKLMFFLIGINSIDLAYAVKPVKGRLEYDRRKTGKHYSIRIEPEALRIIQKYACEDRLLNILSRCPNYKTYFNRMGKTLRKVGMERIPGKRSFGKPIIPDICLGAARTSWATIAQEDLDIPREIIAAALGHHTVDVTTTYLRTDWKNKVDAANRRVIDWVLYKKK